jgi:signal transduction histidine kinase
MDEKVWSSAAEPSILVVDDNVENLRLLTQTLSPHGYKIRVAKDGKRALAAVEAQPPNLILLDIMMPDMDGYEVCRRLKAHPQTRDIPVIFISALDETLDKVKAFRVGGVDYVTKPFEVEEVLVRVETHLTLRELQRRLEQQVNELDAFAHTVAHDLKSPLGILQGYADIIAFEARNMESSLLRESAAMVSKTVMKMSNIVDELLLLSTIRQMTDVPFEVLDTGDIVKGACERLAGMMKEYPVTLVLPDEWPEAWGYGPWVEEVWVNLISNALKYGRDGEEAMARVELGAQRVFEGSEPYVRFWVRDHGPGLEPEEQGQLFKEFARLHQLHAQGHGLGLSIVRRIVERLGGQVGVESAVGEGSSFYFILPAKRT